MQFQLLHDFLYHGISKEIETIPAQLYDRYFQKVPVLKS